jgi:redox-sensitive bicupin YhaK (pirin superfamily)
MLDLIIEERRRDLGGGMIVGRTLPFVRPRKIGPFIFRDHAGPLTLQAGFPAAWIRGHTRIWGFRP